VRIRAIKNCIVANDQVMKCDIVVIMKQTGDESEMIIKNKLGTTQSNTENK
jgi:hypothetical protein